MHAVVTCYNRGEIVCIGRPAEDGLNVETLALSVFIICCDAFGRLGFDVVDAQYMRNTGDACKRCPTSVAELRFHVLMCASTRRTEIKSSGPEGCGVLGARFRGELCFPDAISAAFVINHAARSKLGDAKKAGALEKRRPRPTQSDRGDIGVER